MVNMEIEGNKVFLRVYTTGEEKNAKVVLEKKDEVVFEETVDISPVAVYEKKVNVQAEKKTDITVRK